MDRTEYQSADQDTSRKRPDQGDRHIIPITGQSIGRRSKTIMSIMR